MYYKQGSKLDPDFKDVYAADCKDVKRPVKNPKYEGCNDGAHPECDLENYAPIVEPKFPHPQDGNPDLLPR